MPLAEKLDLMSPPPADRRDDSGFNGWLQSLPADDWRDAVSDSDFTEVEWVDGIGFVERGA